MRFRLLIAIIFSCVLHVQVKAAPFELDFVETDDLLLIYQDPFQTYLVPHMSKSFHNSLEFQRYLFDWTPHEKTTVVMNDFSDYGNAGASVSPRNAVSVYIAPSNRTLETLPGNERTFMIMNHEMTHVATMDVANTQDLRWRRFLAASHARPTSTRSPFCTTTL